jgi:hypothetical protein
VAKFVHHVLSTVQEDFVQKRPRHQQRSEEELHPEETTCVRVFICDSPIAREVHLAENTDRMHL